MQCEAAAQAKDNAIIPPLGGYCGTVTQKAGGPPFHVFDVLADTIGILPGPALVGQKKIRVVRSHLGERD
jgi:hypothetical protein